MAVMNENKSHRTRIRKGDMVVVISGADKSDTARRVLAVYPKENRILVEGVRVAKRSYRKGANPNLPQGGIHEKEMPIHISNVMLADPKTGEPTRVGVRYDTARDGRIVRVRTARKSGTDLKD